jgi:hypothetical protein
MIRRVRVVVALLITFALPLQGIAGVTMLHCDSLPRSETAGAAMQHDAHEHHHHQADSDTPRTPDVLAETTDHASSAVDDGYNVVTVGCSACASCCTGAASAVSDHRPPEFFFTLDIIAATPIPVPAGFISDGPYHPPRTLVL